jgi:hypothetical protein
VSKSAARATTHPTIRTASDMEEITNSEEFAERLAEAFGATTDMLVNHANDATLFDIELQLDIMRRRTSDGQVPTTLEKERITMAGTIRDRFPFSKERTVDELRYIELLTKVHYFYVMWHGSDIPLSAQF